MAFLVSLGPVTVLAQSSFEPLGELSGGVRFSSASGVSSFDAAGGEAANLVVVGNSQGTLGREAFRWTRSGGMVGLGSLGGSFFFSNAAAVNGDGSFVVGASSADDGVLAYRWQAGLGMQSLGDLPGGPVESEATGISADGLLVVGTSRSASGPDGEEAFIWTPTGGLVGLGSLLSGGYSRATGVSADGATVVGTSGVEFDFSTAHVWTSGGGLVALPQFPGEFLSSTGLGVSADGTTIVGSAMRGGSMLAVRWTDAGIESLGSPRPFEDSSLFAQAANEDGSIIVGYGQAGGVLSPFYWTADGGMRALAEVMTSDFGLDLTGWTLTLALDLTTHGDSGRTAIVGVGTNPLGQSEAFLAVLDPSPPCAVDLDGDGEATVFDLLIFQNLFDSGDLRADFDGDGVLTLFDYLAFQTAFDAGCE